MARPKEWERIARDQHLSLRATLGSMADELEQIHMNIGNGVYHNNKGLLAKDILSVDRQLSGAIMFSRELQALIEDNNKTATEIIRSKESEIARRTYRHKEGEK